MRIILSYGHDANEELVRRVFSNLEKRGHNVWSDKEDIRPGDQLAPLHPRRHAPLPPLRLVPFQTFHPRPRKERGAMVSGQTRRDRPRGRE
jgi:hypothetical protein